MNYKTLLHTDLKVASLALGADYFSTDVREPLSYELMDCYRAHGGNVLDTARLYADGQSEYAIGRYLKSRGCRNETVVVTKCAHPPITDMTISRLSPEEIESDIDTSLKALQTDYIDLLFLHRDDPRLKVDGILDTLNRMVQKGKIRYFGASNWNASRLAEADQYAASSDQQTFAASQIKWSAAQSVEEDKTLVEMSASQYPYYQQTKRPVFAFCSQAKGFFTKFDNDPASVSGKAKNRFYTPYNLEVYSRIKQVAESTGLSVTAVTLSYLTSNQDFDTIAIIGCKTVAQLTDSLCAADTVLTQEQVAFIRNLNRSQS